MIRDYDATWDGDSPLRALFDYTDVGNIDYERGVIEGETRLRSLERIWDDDLDAYDYIEVGIEDDKVVVVERPNVSGGEEEGDEEEDNAAFEEEGNTDAEMSDGDAEMSD